MNKAQIDRYFTENYDDILLYINKRFSQTNRFKEIPECFFSNLYIYIIDRKGKIEDEKQLKKWIGQFIYMNTYWNNSTALENRREYHSTYNYTELQLSNYDEEYTKEENIDLQRKEISKLNTNIEEMIIYEEMNTINNAFYNQLDSMLDKAIWEILFIHKKQTVRAFAEYINRPPSSAQNILKPFKEKMRRYYNKTKQG